jgi:hypothetical protein
MIPQRYRTLVETLKSRNGMPSPFARRAEAPLDADDDDDDLPQGYESVEDAVAAIVGAYKQARGETVPTPAETAKALRAKGQAAPRASVEAARLMIDAYNAAKGWTK